MLSPTFSMGLSLAATPPGELQRWRHLVVARELLLDAADGLDPAPVQEHPLVRRRPCDEEPAGVRRPGDVAELAGAGEEELGVSGMVDVYEAHLAAPRPVQDDGNVVRSR